MMINKIFIVMCGVPGSGKSTWTKNFLKEHKRTKVVSRDEIRFSIVKENEPYFSKENQVYSEFIRQIKEGLNDENIDTVIADATHLNVPSRRKLFHSLGEKIFEDAIVVCRCFDIGVENCIKFNELRKGTRAYVPEDAIRNMANAFSIPTKEEGYFNFIILDTSEEEQYDFK